MYFKQISMSLIYTGVFFLRTVKAVVPKSFSAGRTFQAHATIFIVHACILVLLVFTKILHVSAEKSRGPATPDTRFS